MKKQLLYAVIFVTVVGAAVIHAWRAYPQLPEHMATHFNGAGIADGWGERDSFFFMEMLVGIVLALLFAGIAIGVRLLPIHFVHVPYKAYWLSEERRAASLAFLTQRFLMLGIISFVFYILLNQEIFKANLRNPQRLSGDFTVTLIAYAVFVLYWVGGLLLRFRKPAAAASVASDS